MVKSMREIAVDTDKKKCLHCKKLKSKYWFSRIRVILKDGEIRLPYCNPCREKYPDKKILWNKARSKLIYGEYWARYRKTHKEELKINNANYYTKAKIEMIKAYGGKCVCCNETHRRFLTIDHTSEIGYKHRKSIKRYGSTFYAWLRKQGYPKDKYRLLCMNCNFATRLGDVCPHQEKN